MASKVDGHTMQTIANLDRHLENLMNCKPIPEDDVKKLCEMVRFSFFL